jgi:hypothetical protein
MRAPRVARAAAGIAACAIAVAAPGTAPAQGASLLAPLTDERAWLVTGLPKQKVPPTRFVRGAPDGVPTVRLETDGGYGVLVHRLEANGTTPSPVTLQWRWRLDQPVAGADLREKATDDAALKVCAMFELPLERVPFVERQLLRLAQVLSGEPLPAATLCYVWAPLLPAQTLMANAYTRRMRWLVLQGRGSALQQWRSERRDLRADFLRAFSDESAEVPPLAAVLVGADADNTGGRGAGEVAALELRP